MKKILNFSIPSQDLKKNQNRKNNSKNFIWILEYQRIHAKQKKGYLIFDLIIFLPVRLKSKVRFGE